MRRIAFAVLLTLAACGPREAREHAGVEGCALSATHEIAWSADGAPDTVTARAEGPTCAQAFVTLTIRGAQGEPLWAYASTHYAMTAGDGALPADAPAVSNEAMSEFLRNWANIAVQHSNELPAWREGEAGPRGETFGYHTDFPRDAYEMLRERNLTMACYASGAEAVECLVIDPFSHAPAKIVAYGP